MAPILIIDGNNLAHRAKHAYSLTFKGVDVSITYGFLRILNGYLSRFRPSSVIVCWDGGTPEFRRQAVSCYKTNRHHDDDPVAYEDFLRQVRELCDYVLPMVGVVSVFRRNCEADDLMYHASRMLSGEVIIITTDKDLLQAVTDDGVTVFSPTKEKHYTPEEVEKEFDVDFANYIDWRALQGDGSDNIPGVPGIGEKTASRLFREFGNLTSITNAAAGRNPRGKLSGKIADSILGFGLDNIARNVHAMALYADRVGARYAIIDSVKYWMAANPKRLNKWLMKKAFVTLLTEGFSANFSKLTAPKLYTKGQRIPVVPVRRSPVYD